MRSRRGLTLIEMMIVMVIVTILVSIAVRIYQKALSRSLEDLVRKGYLREIPVDMIAGSNTTWKVIMEEAMTSVSQNEPGIFDVRSGSDKISLEGTPYSEW